MSRTADSFTAAADKLYDLSLIPYQDEFNLLSEAHSIFPGEPEVLWRLARSMYHLGTELHADDQEQKKNWLEKGWKVAKEVTAKFPDNVNGWKFAGILLGTLVDSPLITMKDRIGFAYEIKDDFLAAERLAPKDDTVKAALGKWCWTIAQIGFVERQVAKVLFAAPPTSSYEEALGFLGQAYALLQGDPKHWKPTEAQVCLVTAKCHEGLGTKKEAIKWFEKVLQIEGDSKALVRDRLEARTRLDSLNSSWW